MFAHMRKDKTRKIVAARDYLQQAIGSVGLEPTEVARGIGVNPSTINKVVSVKGLPSHAPGLDTLQKVANLTNYPLTQEVKEAYEIVGPETEPTNVTFRSHVHLAQAPNEWAMIPVLGTARAGSEGAFELNEGQPIDFIRRPMSLAGVKDAYSIYINGDSMWPKFEPNQLIIVHAKRPASPGRDVVIQIRPPHEGQAPLAYVKRLVRRTATEVEVLQFNPEKRRVFKMADVVSIHLILREDELI